VNQFLKNIGGFALGVIGFAAVIVVLFLLVQGGTWLADKVYPILILLFVLTLAVTVFILLPLAIFRKTRGVAGVGIYITSYIYGLTVWVWSLLITYTLWGGVGIVPLSVVACLFKGMFSIAFQVVLLAAFVFGVRAFALFLVSSAERYQEV
jgi:hypothetical protein